MTDPAVNAPWVESPFFSRELSARPTLNATEIEQVTQYHTFGYLRLDDVIGDELAERVKTEAQGLFKPDVPEGYASYYRVHDAWQTSPAVKELALNDRILSTLRLLYGREPIPFQTLNFLYGSQQANHSDAILFNSLPARYMCGVWVALEDVGLESGPLFYYPGSQRLKEYYVQDFSQPGDNPDDFFNRKYPHFISQLMAMNSFEREQLQIRKGSALIWSSNLVHGGMPRLDQALTRWTQVTHYFFQDCVYYVPLYSDNVAGDFCLRDVVDLRNGSPVLQTYNGRRFIKVPASKGRWKIQFLQEMDSLSGEDLVVADATGPAEHRGIAARILDRLPIKHLIGPRAHAVLPRFESTQITFFLDGFEDGPVAASLFGWAFLVGNRGEKQTVQIALKSDRDSYVIDCNEVTRPDVPLAYPGSSSHAGFQVSIDKCKLLQGTYRVGLVIRIQGQEPALRFTDRTIKIGS